MLGVFCKILFSKICFHTFTWTLKKCFNQRRKHLGNSLHMSAALHFASGVRLCNRPSALVMCDQTKTTLNGSPHFPGFKVYSHNICPHKYCPVNTNTQCTARHILFEISWRMLQDYFNSAPLTEVVIAGQYSSFNLGGSLSAVVPVIASHVEWWLFRLIITNQRSYFCTFESRYCRWLNITAEGLMTHWSRLLLLLLYFRLFFLYYSTCSLSINSYLRTTCNFLRSSLMFGVSSSTMRHYLY